MGLDSVIHNLPPEFGKPSQEDILLAEQEMTDQQAYLSADPTVRAVQLKTWAMGYVAARRSAKASGVTAIDYAQRERELQAEKERKALRHMVGGTIYETATLTGPETVQTDLTRYLLNDFPASGKVHLMLLGGTGAGKTYGALAYVAARAKVFPTARGSQWDCVFVRARELSELLGAGEEKRERLKELKLVRWLIIDDLKVHGEGSVTSAYISLFEDLFSHRNDYAKPMFITSNATLEDIAQTYGDRFVSRFKGSGQVYSTSTPDMRASC